MKLVHTANRNANAGLCCDFEMDRAVTDSQGLISDAGALAALPFSSLRCVTDFDLMASLQEGSTMDIAQTQRVKTPETDQPGLWLQTRARNSLILDATS